MIVLRATEEQYNSLNGFSYKASKLEFVKDGANNWVVGTEVLYDDDFISIRNELLNLEEIEYLP